MKITIHRGTHQIGGCITEINHEDYRLFIDLGEPLPGTPNTESIPIEGLTQGDTTRSALFITHYHEDHIGRILEAQHEVPIYMGKTALEIYKCTKNYLFNILQPDGKEKLERILKRMENVHTFTPGKDMSIGPFRIIPLMVDHSAFDAYMFVIEAGGTRLLYTGDFRGHGFRSKALPKLMAVYAKEIDYIISEGTNIYRTVEIESEQTLQRRFIEEFRQSKYNFVLTASTNIDRIFSLYHAAYQAGRIFVCDNYQKKLMDIVVSNHGVYTSFYQIREQIPVSLLQGSGIFAKANQMPYFARNKIFHCSPIRFIPLSPGNPDYRTFHTFKRIPSRIQIDCFGIVHIIHTAYSCHVFQPMPRTSKILEAFLDGFLSQVLNPHRHGLCHRA